MSDFDFTDSTPVNSNTIFDQLIADVSKDPNRKEYITLAVPARPALSVRFRLTDLTMDKIDRWRKNNTKKAGTPKEEVDTLRVSKLAIVAQCDAILVNGEAVTRDDKNVTFSDNSFMDSIGVLDYYAAVAKFYGNDEPAIISTFEKILDGAGFGQDVSEVEEGGADPLF